MRPMIALTLFLLLMLSGGSAVPGSEPTAVITATGSLQLSDGTMVPPFPKAGNWTKLQRKSSDRHETQHFIYLVPNESPAIELYLAVDKRGDPPDGVFEVGMVLGFVQGFASEAGLTPEKPVFEEIRIGPGKVKQALVKLSDSRRKLWVQAYIFVRRPSLTFIAIRAQEPVTGEMENYLSGVVLKGARTGR
jgi:hypothetical protein